jgi:Ca-activated chloride channel homolog
MFSTGFRLPLVVCVFHMVISAALAQTAATDSSTLPPSATAVPAQNTAPASMEATPSADPTAVHSSVQQPVAQEPSASDAGASDQASMFVFKKEVEEVVLHATVFDNQRQIVPDLDRTAFSVLENGVPQAITSFRRQDVPVAMGIVIDDSGSMRDKRDEVNRAVLNLIRASNPKDEIFVVNFSQNSYLDQDFTSDVNLLQAALQQVSATGSTALYDAVVASAVHLNNNPRLDKRILLVITDGQDNMSQQTLGEALRRLQQTDGLTVYSVGLLGSGLQKRGRQALEQLAQGTGGVAYFPENLDQVEDITRTVGHDIRSQYLITYKPLNQNLKPDQKSVSVEARASGNRKLVVSTRKGFHYAGDLSR